MNTVSELRETIRARLNALHAERGECVCEAKRLREERGYGCADFQMEWRQVEILTERILAAERELEALGE